MSILGISLCNAKICCFQNHFVSFYRSIQMVAIMLEIIPSFYAKISEKGLFFSANTYEMYIVCKDYCIAHHDDQTCFLPACIYHNILLRNVEELLKKLDTFCFTYQHVDCLYILLKYRFSGKIIARSGKVFDNVQRSVDFHHGNKGVDRMPSIAKKRLLRKKLKQHFLSALQKKNQRRPAFQFLQEELKKSKRQNLNWS